MFDENKDRKGEIALANILVVESTNDPKFRSNSVFDVHARVLEGGDVNGMRIFTFDAKSGENAEIWMRELCRATEILELEKTHKGGFASAVSNKMVQARNTKKRTVSVSNYASAQTLGNQLNVNSNLGTPIDDSVSATSDSLEGSGSGTAAESEANSPTASKGIRRKGMGRGMDFRGASYQSTALKKGVSAMSVSSSNNTPEKVQVPTDNSPKPGESYDIYGEGGI